jgi:peptidoglycan/xylan/chitin deacetylase (PgdA/CDA1 family)
MRAISLMYHDVVKRGERDASGFPGATAGLYKLDREAFASHLGAIAKAIDSAPVTVGDLLTTPASSGLPVMITFDDGGESAYSRIAGMLEERGWHGHFFVATDFIDALTFLRRAQIRELHRRGHVIGSHTASHPLRMAHCSRAELLREWRTSIEILSDAVGESIVDASVPGGHYSRAVAAAAAEAGIRALFTSEPTAKCHEVDGVLVFGRYTIQRWSTPETAAALAQGRFAACAKQRLLWDAKKVAKAVGGEHYLALRKALLGLSSSTRG